MGEKISYASKIGHGREESVIILQNNQSRNEPYPESFFFFNILFYFILQIFGDIAEWQSSTS